MKRKVFVLVAALVVVLTLVVAVSAQSLIPQEYTDALADMENAVSADFESTINEDILADMVEHADSMEIGQASEIEEME